MGASTETYLEQGKAKLQEFPVTFARLVAGIAMDPHGYFDKRYTARIERAESEQEIRGVLVQLVQWASSSSVSPEEREQLDRQLDEHNLPSVADLRTHLLR